MYFSLNYLRFHDEHTKRGFSSNIGVNFIHFFGVTGFYLFELQVIRVHDKFNNGASHKFPNNPRVLGMAATLASNGTSINKITKYVRLIAPIVRDESAKYEFLTAVGAMGNRSLIVKRIEDRKLKIFDEWDVEFDNNEAFMLNNFPVAPFLAMNLEILPYPNCEASKKPTLLYVKATKNGEVWVSEPDIISDDDSARWVIRFKDITEFDKRSLNRRVVVSTSCV